MELSDFARQVLLSDSLDAKLRRPDGSFTDENPGEPLRISAPTRPENLQFAARRTAPAMPKGQAFSDPAKRAIAHHIMANHELQALEVMAMVMLAFPTAPSDFRFGLAEVMLDEQRHTKLHANRAAELGAPFGSLPVNSYIWTKATEYASVMEYLAGLPLVFEGANLDHTVEFEKYFLQHDDTHGAAIMKAIHRDEIRHVAFGLEWLRRLKDPSLSDFDAWEAALRWPIRPKHARGDKIQAAARSEAGMDDEFLERLREWSDDASDKRA